MWALSNGFSLRMLADITGLSETTLSSIRDQERPTRQPDTLWALARIPEVGTSADVVVPTPQDESGAPRHISGSVSGGVRFGGHATGSVGPVFESEERRKGYLQKVLADAARAIREAQEALDAPLSAQAGDAAAPPIGEGEEAERRRQAELAMRLQWEAQQRQLAQQRVLQPAPPPPVRSRG